MTVNIKRQLARMNDSDMRDGPAAADISHIYHVAAIGSMRPQRLRQGVESGNEGAAPSFETPPPD
jgi:hypothetical protein